MPETRGGLGKTVLWLDVLATPLLLFILAGLWLYRQQIFVTGSPVAGAGLIMLIGFGSILLFNIVSLFWLGRSRSRATGGRGAGHRLFWLGLLCLLLMAAEKVMADEVAHETEGVWSIQGEYVMLYGMLLLQLIYNLLVGKRLLGARGKGGEGHEGSE